jgi:antitoxin ParD1/3/4
MKGIVLAIDLYDYKSELKVKDLVKIDDIYYSMGALKSKAKTFEYLSFSDGSVVPDTLDYNDEMFLNNTIQDILQHIEADTEVIAVLDGVWMDVPQHERVNVIYLQESIGQRAATNLGLKIAQGKYQTLNEAINKGIELLKFQEEIYQGRFAELQKEIIIGVKASERGELIDSELLFSQLENKLREVQREDH